MKTKVAHLSASPRRTIPLHSASSGVGSVPLRQRVRHRRGWEKLIWSLHTALAGLIDSGPYQQISLGRELSVAFTSQGPIVYRSVRSPRQNTRINS
jgi:hypothetical protein